MANKKIKRVAVVVLLAVMTLAAMPMAAQSAAGKLSVSSAVLSKGDRLDIDVKGSNEAGGAYASSNKNVASVSKKGVVTAKKTGNAVVTWKKGKKELSCSLKVVKAPGISTDSLTLQAGESRAASVKAYGNLSLKVAWASQNTAVASVKGGTVTGVSGGTTEVTAKIKGNQKQWTRTVSVTVKKAGAQTPGKSDAGTPGTSGQASPVVYMASDISPKGLMAVYRALGWKPEGKVAVKLSTGEPPSSNYLAPSLIKNLVQHVDGTIVECNTAYGGSRASTAMHMQVAKDHGFADIADVDIQDADGSMAIAVAGGKHLKKNYVGANFGDYDSYLVLSHFKGHSMAGFGGAVKNISIGLGSSEGKCWIHSGGKSRTNAWGGKQDDFLESMAEAGRSVSDYLGNGRRIAYINVMNRLSVDCDCDGTPAKPKMKDIGILASDDPVALDQACVDLIYKQKNGDGASLVKRIESRNGLHTLEYAQQIGLGSRTYRLVAVDG